MNNDVSASLNYLSVAENNPELKVTATFVNLIEKWFSLVTSRNVFKALSRKK